MRDRKSRKDYVHAAEVLKVLAHPVRLLIMEALRNGEMSVTGIYQCLKIGQPAASQHLRIMRNKGILKDRRQGSCVFYSVANPCVREIIACVHHFCRKR